MRDVATVAALVLCFCILVTTFWRDAFEWLLARARRIEQRRDQETPGCDLFGPPLVRLEWANHVPVVFIESGDPGEVAMWMEAAKEGPVLHV